MHDCVCRNFGAKAHFLDGAHEHEGTQKETRMRAHTQPPFHRKQERLTFDLYHSACLENTEPGIDQRSPRPDSLAPPPRPTPTARPPFLFSPLTLDSPSSFHPTSPFAIITPSAQQAAVGRLQRFALMARRLDAPCNVSHDSEDRVWHKMLHVKLESYA